MPDRKDGKIKQVLRRLFTRKSIPAWILTLIPLARPLYNLVDAVSNLDFILSARENPRLKSIWHFLTSQAGTFLVMVVGLCWLTYLALRKTGDKTTAPTAAADEGEGTIAKVAILTPLDKWSVGWHRTVCGSVFPPESAVQVLVQPPNDCWYKQDTVDVNGELWTCKCRFGEQGKAGMSYNVVAVHGKPLKLEKYDDLPEGLVKSKIITVHRNSDEDIIYCPDKQLHQTKIHDKNAIKDLVKVCGIRYQEIAKGREPAHIDFTVVILNLSLYRVSVDSVVGFINFHIDEEIYTPKLPPVIDKNKARNLPFRGDGYFVIQQDFKTDLERDYLLKAPPDSTFYFNPLKIMLTGDGLEATELKLDIAFSKKDGHWVAHVFAGLADERRTFNEMESRHAFEITALHQQLEGIKKDFKSRISCTEELSKVYGSANQLLLAFRNKPPSVGTLKYWAETLDKALYNCYGLSGNDKFARGGAYTTQVPEADSEQSNWLYITWQRLGDLIKEQRLELDSIAPSVDGDRREYVP